MNNNMQENEFKRHIAYKLRIGDILKANPIFENERLKFLELGDKKIIRINLIANVIDKYVQDNEKKFASLTLDDASGQIKIKLFGDEIIRIGQFVQGDTLSVIGLVRSWNNEIYITPEIIKKKDPLFLLIRKLEIDLEKPKEMEKAELGQIRSEIMHMIKINDETGGIDVEKLVMDLKASPEAINSEIRKLLEEGLIYEPRPGRLRYLG